MPINDRSLEDGKRFVPMSAGFVAPATHASFMIPLATRLCSHKILQDKCLTRPTPWRCMIVLAAELSQCRWILHVKPAIHSTSLHKRIPSEVPLEQAYTSASALERETNF